ncbi:ankyrin repeat domain-containing protein [Pararhodobacter aggregans]|uniref:Uncharacterized protein n=1 Tax=Pararhodobacter aggregans TaxID=404875 RepID=A0A2T7UV25_9RHOB|nr:ankyrin repeat domain-containing protein [Pararhodobacter aggregans]PTX04108.1 hypothetical protein C8N33_102385 [Pararhodobacter aggregans]PVE48428.1 hypothetical protein DDE23_05030 [Pararhodobacter aggregans]
MHTLPDRPNPDQLKRQAKELLAAFRSGDAAAINRFRASLPAAAGQPDDAIRNAGFRLHDAQSCLAREYGFPSWSAMAAFVDTARLRDEDATTRRTAFLRALHAGDICGGMDNPRPSHAARLLETYPDVAQGCAVTACATGDIAQVRQAIAEDSTWINRPAGPLALPPLLAATHSSLIGNEAFRPRIVETVRLLLASGADPNQRVGSRWPPASLAAPDERTPLSALYGAAGRNHDAALTALLLEAGADPDDGESLYHSLDGPACTRLLLEAGATVTGTNALFRVLDMDDVATLRLLLDHAREAPELDDGRLLFWAIRRRRSPAHIQALLDAGVSALARTEAGLSAAQLALRYGLPAVAALLGDHGAQVSSPRDEQFIAACAGADADAARRILAAEPDLLSRLDQADLRLLPELAAAGASDAVQVMVSLGWPVETCGGDWNASALNHAVFRGDRAMKEFLLTHGASWRAQHGFGDDVSGTLGWASLNRPEPDGDWVGCAEALRAHGMPAVQRDPGDPTTMLLEGRPRRFSEDVAACLSGEEETLQ